MFDQEFKPLPFVEGPEMPSKTFPSFMGGDAKQASVTIYKLR